MMRRVRLAVPRAREPLAAADLLPADSESLELLVDSSGAAATRLRCRDCGGHPTRAPDADRARVPPAADGHGQRETTDTAVDRLPLRVDPAGTAPASESASESASPSAVDGEGLTGVVTADEPTPRQTPCDLTRRPSAGADGPGSLADTGDPPHDPKGGRWLSGLRVRQRERASEKTPQLRWFPVFDAVLRVRGSLTDPVPPRRNWFGPVRSG